MRQRKAAALLCSYWGFFLLSLRVLFQGIPSDLPLRAWARLFGLKKLLYRSWADKVVAEYSL